MLYLWPLIDIDSLYILDLEYPTNTNCHLLSSLNAICYFCCLLHIILCCALYMVIHNSYQIQIWYLKLTLPMLRLLSSKAQWCKKHLNPVVLVFIRKPSLCTLRWKPMCQGFSHFSGFQSFFMFLHHFVLHKLGTRSIRVELQVKCLPIISVFAYRSLSTGVSQFYEECNNS